MVCTEYQAASVFFVCLFWIYVLNQNKNEHLVTLSCVFELQLVDEHEHSSLAMFNKPAIFHIMYWIGI